jgi:hypothetical protein
MKMTTLTLSLDDTTDHQMELEASDIFEIYNLYQYIRCKTYR